MQYSKSLAITLHLTLALLAYGLPNLWVKSGLLIALSLSSLIRWLAAFKRYHLIVDTPTCAVASAPQGYVELVGRSDLHPDTPPLGYMSGPPCVWYRYSVHERNDNQTRRLSCGESTDTFLLRDHSGVCVIDPVRAEVVGARHKRWTSNDYTYAIDYIAPGDPLYVLGELASQSKCMTPSERKETVSGILAEWKRDRRALLERFDKNNDDHIDLNEWEAARVAANEEAERIACQNVGASDLHILSAPSDGRPFVLSRQSPSVLAKGFYRWAWIHAATLLGAALALVSLCITAGTNCD